MIDKSDLFLITGATGRTGASTVTLLREQGLPVRALVHRLDHRATSLLDQGAEVVQGDLLDFHAVSSAMAGVTAAYFNYPIAPGLVEAAATFAQAAGEAGVHAVVNMSQISARREAASNAARAHWIAERLLDRTAMLTTHLRPTFFMEWLNWSWIRHTKEGIYRLPFADVRHAPIASADQARVIAAILVNPAPHDRQIYPLVGAEELNYHEIAAKVQHVLGIPARYEPIDISSFVSGLNARGVSPHLAQHLSNVAQDYRDGIFAGINNLVEVISGSKPTTVEDYVMATRDQFNNDGFLAISDALLPAA